MQLPNIIITRKNPSKHQQQQKPLHTVASPKTATYTYHSAAVTDI